MSNVATLEIFAEGADIFLRICSEKIEDVLRHVSSLCESPPKITEKKEGEIVFKPDGDDPRQLALDLSEELGVKVSNPMQISLADCFGSSFYRGSASTFRRPPK